MNVLKSKILRSKIYFSNIRERINNKINYNFSRNAETSKRINSRYNSYNALFIFPFLYLPQIAYLADEDDKKESESKELEMKDIVRGEYENKIRTFSSIEKRFLIFSKIKTKGDYRMTYFQFLDSLVPFQYIKTKNSEDLANILNENADFLKIMKKIDINGDGFINFEEFIILSVIMSVPVEEYLETYPSGKITREQLSDFLMSKISQIESLKITSKSLVDGRTIKTDYNKLYTFMVDFISLEFKNTVIDINKDLSQYSFEVFLLCSFYEFYRIPQTGEKKISKENFARVLLSYVNIYKNKVIRKKIEDKLINLEGDVNFEEFVCFFWFLKCLSRNKLDVFKEGHINLKELRKVADEKIKYMPNTGFKIRKEVSEKTLKLLIDLFDENGNGKLDFHEINDILKRRTFYSNSKQDFMEETRSIGAFFYKGYTFIKDNLWFL